MTGPVLVTGAGGFVGQAIVADLAARGRRVRAATRDGGGSFPDGVESVVTGDLADSPDWASVLSGVDAIVHCAARAHVLNDDSADPLADFRRVNTEPTLALARAAITAGVRRFVFVSSIGVNGGETQGRAFRSDDPVAPHSPYAVAKAEAEQGLRSLLTGTTMDLVIIRPPLVIGPGAKGNVGLLEKAVRKGLPLPFGLVTRNRRDLVSLEVLADLVATVLDHPAAAGQTFLVSDGRARSTRQIIESIAAGQSRPARFLPVPPFILALALKAVGKGTIVPQLLGDLEVDIAHTRNTLGWTPPAVR